MRIRKLGVELQCAQRGRANQRGNFAHRRDADGFVGAGTPTSDSWLLERVRAADPEVAALDETVIGAHPGQGDGRSPNPAAVRLAAA